MSRLFGTDGVRGVANTDLTSSLAYRLGRAGAYVLTKESRRPKILVGMDTRVSGDMLEAALVAGILSVGADAVCLGVVPTPAVAYLTRKYEADAGVVISASHNPFEYNGIKFFDKSGYKLKDELEDEIQRLIESNMPEVPNPSGKNIGRKTIESRAISDYVKYLISNIDGDLEGIKVALDCANGAAFEVAVKAFRKLKAEVVVINDSPDGYNINNNCGSTHPEELMNYVKAKGCNLGLAFDGDADRCLAVDENGTLVDGDQVMMICGKYLKEEGKLKDDTIVVTVMSNLGMFQAMEREDIKNITTKVGDRYVLEEMVKNGYSLGGEQSGHIIFLDTNTTGDGTMTALTLANIVKKTGKSLSSLAKIMKILPQVLINAKIPNHRKNIYLEDIEIVDKIRFIEDTIGKRGRVLIRPSGTEPLVRVMLEGEDEEEINRIAKDLVDLIEKKAKV